MSVSCILDQGLSLGCRSTGGGSTKLWLGTFSGSTAWAFDVNNIITGVTLNNTFYEFEAPQGTIDVSETVEGSVENYNIAVTQTVTSLLAGISQTEADVIQLMGQYPLYAIVKHSNANWYLFGYENGLWMNTATRSFGKTKSDAVKIDFTLTGMEDIMAPQVSTTLLTTLGIS